ncbi:MAG: DUF5320 domain-containing protein [Spirochaetales bacterium]|nr:DUF5320 domain-containing protein [Spirochaetales bacterium]
MPGGDGTGPAGLGPMTGRAAGFCAGYSIPGYANPVWGRGGFGRGFGRFGGRGRGFRNRFFSAGFAGFGNVYTPYAPPAVTVEQEADVLRNQVKYLQDHLNALNQRIQELENLEAEKPRK